MTVREAQPDEWEDAMSLAWHVFSKFEANVYPKEGVDSFIDFISDNQIKKMFLIGSYKCWVAVEDDRIIGIAGLRSRKHLSLLFVHEKYQRRGVATELMKCVSEYITNTENLDVCTVNAAPYALPFYEAIGFRATGPEEMNSGMIFTPMLWQIR